MATSADPNVVSQNLDGPLPEAEQSGMDAMRQPRFGLRCAEWFFAMVAFSLMGSAENVNSETVTMTSFIIAYPNGSAYDGTDISGDCVCDYSGEFDFSAYRYVVAVGVFLWIYTMVIIALSLLPTRFMGHECCVKNFGFIQLVLDGVLLFLIFCAIMAAATDVDASSEFDCDGIHGEDDAEPLKQCDTFYTLDSFFETYEHRGYEMTDNPVHKIRGAIAMIFFCFFLLAYNMLLSFNLMKGKTDSLEAVGNDKSSAAPTDTAITAGSQL